jgi:hypothetical protein
VRTALQHHDFGLRTRRVGGDAALAQSAETSDVMFVCLALCLSCRLPVRLSRCLALFPTRLAGVGCRCSGRRRRGT